MLDDSITIDVLHGVQNDPRVGAETIIYGLGSYVATPLPSTHDYLYCIITHNGTAPITLEGLYLQLGEGEQASLVRDLDVPAKYFRGRKLHPGQRLAIGFLRDLFTRRLRWYSHAVEPLRFRVGCEWRQGGHALSRPVTLSLNYPAGPMQDAELSPYALFFERRTTIFTQELARIRETYGTLSEYASLHCDLGMHKQRNADGTEWWVLREWMPAATDVWLTTDALQFARDERYLFERVTPEGLWELKLPVEALPHGTYIELRLVSPHTKGREVRRVPAFATRVEQNPHVLEEWCARVWDPETPYVFCHDAQRTMQRFPRIYEAHIGIAQTYHGRTEASVGTYALFTRDVLPRVHKGGYTAIQLMGVLEHPLYKSFGYQVSSYFAPSSRFGTPEELCELIDTAHSLGLAVILDIPHSHSAPNTEQGLARYDSSSYFFAAKGNQWGTISFDYQQEMTRRFLLSNCRYWLEVFHVDGFRFDAVGNMIYTDHGFGDSFSHVERCFFTEDGTPRIDEAGVLYLSLANTLVRETASHAITLAEEFSGMPGMTSPPEKGGLGFDYRFAMGIPDFWAKWIKEGRTLGDMWYEMNNRRSYEKTVSYVACHDQSINGKDAMLWRMVGDAMYTGMSCFSDEWAASRGVALYKLMRLVTLSTAGHGYLNFMGDEFGHPEWIDAENYGHRQWHLPKEEHTRYAGLDAFDRDSVHLVQQYMDDFAAVPQFRHLHEADSTLAFERGALLFVFNFNELVAQQALELWVPPGKYVEVMSSDAVAYAGHGNLDVVGRGVEHFSEAGFSSDNAAMQRIVLYMPPMVALVLHRE